MDFIGNKNEFTSSKKKLYNYLLFILANPGNNVRIHVTKKLTIHEKMIPTNSKDSTVTHHEKSVHLTSQVYHKIYINHWPLFKIPLKFINRKKSRSIYCYMW